MESLSAKIARLVREAKEEKARGSVALSDDDQPGSYSEELESEILDSVHAKLSPKEQERLAINRLLEACEAGDHEIFSDMMESLRNDAAGGMRTAMSRISRLHSVSPEIQQTFLWHWIESKSLSIKVGNRRVAVNALRVLLPQSTVAAPMWLFRGAAMAEHRNRRYQLSWTTEIGIARNFASKDKIEGVVLSTMAEPEAILHVREQDEYYDEGECIVDPFLLGRVTVLERFPLKAKRDPS